HCASTERAHQPRGKIDPGSQEQPSMTMFTSPFELLPDELIEFIGDWVLHTDKVGLHSRKSLLHFAIASPYFFAPAVRAVLRDSSPSTDSFVPVDSEEWQNRSFEMPLPGGYIVISSNDAAAQEYAYLALPQRSAGCDKHSPSDNDLDYWRRSLLPVPLRHIARAQIDACDLSLAPIPPMCRHLNILDCSADQWPMCPLSVQSLELRDCSILPEQLSSFSASFNAGLRELTIGLARIEDESTLSDLYGRLPATLALLKITEDDCFYPDDLGVQSGAALSQALSRMPYLTMLHHELLHRPDDVVHIVNGLTLAQQKGKSMPMRSLSLAFSANIAMPLAQVPLVQGTSGLLASKLSVRFHVYFGQDVTSDEYRSHILDLIRILPKPLHSLTLDMPAWPDRVIPQVMQRFTSPTLQSLHIKGQRRHLWSDSESEFDGSLLKECFQLSSLGRLDVQFPALTSLAVTGCLPRMAIAADSGLAAPWAFPPFLRTLNLSMNQLVDCDIHSLWPLLSCDLRSLMFGWNQIKSLPERFPPLLRSLAVQYNSNMDHDAPWIDALSSTLRLLDVTMCGLGRGAALRLVALHKKVGMQRTNGEPKLTAFVARRKRFVLDAEMQL
ncbi:hypothetical protein AMAG_10709, partial [Allomyces macrogynus ATCC 38327]